MSARASLVVPLLAVPREETHNRCRHCHHRKGGQGRVGPPMVCYCPHSKRGTHQRKKERNEKADHE
ncbi:unnamed protein product [Spirodela intermedia]|uniref:Uncharacterized protein n=1 Tax=Spirodela intermedia TaxID=51605 RepID=A0A7I8J9S1_SPIIN|nr:unnamed protein product [Spirodela intermedia]CAA6666966.1 unnamed protein product [Spirodela intermedia]